MDNLDNRQIQNQSEHVVTIPQQRVSYGRASTVEAASDTVAISEPLTFFEQVNFFFSEYFKGFLFVILTSVFIVAIPKLFTEQGTRRVALYNFMKRILDIVGSISGLILTLPVWLVIPVLIKLDSPGPVFYSQVRVGQNRRKRDRRVYQQAEIDCQRNRDRRRDNYGGETFKVIKFRTMVNDAEKNSGPVWASKNDSRITKLGAFLRKSRIDEIPQFLNVLRGEMSLVGPRPERPNFVMDLTEKVEGYERRLEVKPGLTGLAQVESGYDDSISSVVTKVKYDVEYIENRSIWLDIKIMFKTVKVVFTGKGAH
ncbi:MAG: sugar transferase [Calditrichaeota bacterium]|nr:MAG: sugar transferase [Calditrichota bacterium]